MRTRSALIMLVLLTAAVARPAAAQAIRLDVTNEALASAIVVLRHQVHVDVVYAGRLVDDKAVTCRYRGDDLRSALECLLAGTGLQAERVRMRQYVLVPAPGGHGDGVHRRQAAPRGMLAGFVLDGDTGETLPGAHVYLPDLQIGAATNDAGYFALPNLPKGAYDVLISYLGYTTDHRTMVADTARVTIRLQPTALQSGEIVVEDTRTPESSTVVTGLLTESVNRLEHMPATLGERDLFRALQWFPGVRKTGEVNGGLVVRGGEPDQNLYLLDGAPVYHPWHAFSLISTFQTETFKDIKLYRGALPAEHGGRLAAVLDAQMKDGTRKDPRAVMALSALSGRFIFESPLSSSVSFMVSGRRSYIDKLIGREHPVVGTDGRRDTLRTGYYFYDLSAKITAHKGVRHRLSLSYYRGGDDLDLRLPFDLSLDFSSWLRPADLFFAVRQHWKNQLLSARYQYLHSHRFFVTTTAYASGYDAFEGALLVPTTNAQLVSDYRVRLLDVGAKVDVDYYHSVSHQVQGGVRVVQRHFSSRLDATVQRSPGAVDVLADRGKLGAFEVVAYLQDTWKPAPQWTIQPGLRTSYFSGGAYARLDPRINVRYVVHPEYLVLRAGAGTQVQYLHRLRDRFSLVYDLVSSRWIPADEAVRPARSLQASAGAQSQILPWLDVSAETYWRSSSDILLPEDVFQTKDGLVGPGIEVGTLLGQYTAGEGRAYGLELTAHAQRGAWDVWVSYSGSRALNRAPALGEARMRPSRFDVPRAFRSVIQRDGRHWDFALSTELRSGYPISVPVSRYALGDPLRAGTERFLHRPIINNGRLPPYFRTDFSVGYRFTMFGARWHSQLHVFNVASRRNVISRQYDPSTFLVTKTDRRGLPILPLFEIELTL